MNSSGLWRSSSWHLALAPVSVVSLVDQYHVGFTASTLQTAPNRLLTCYAVLNWRWNFWIQLIFNAGAMCIFFFMPESRATIIMDKEAKRRRKTGEDTNIYGPNELKKPRISGKEILTVWIRPWRMLATEPIVLCLSLLSGFSDALIFTFLESFTTVYAQWNFDTLAVAWAFIPINVAYFIAYFTYYPWFWRDDHVRKNKGEGAYMPERRLKWLLWTAPLEPIGMPPLPTPIDRDPSC